MKKFVKSVLALGVFSALTVSTTHAATYKVIDKGAAEKLKYTYSQQENNIGEMAISGTDVYNFPVQFQHFDDDDFKAIVQLASISHERIHALEDIENEELLRAGNPTANDLSWAILFLESRSSNINYQKVGDVIALVNFGDKSEEFTVYDSFFPATEQYTRSTVDYINGVTDQGWIYGNGSAPYLPINFTETDDDGGDVTLWLREFTTRAFFSSDKGKTILPLMAPESLYGGESVVLDMTDNGIAVGYASTSFRNGVITFINNEDGGCVDPEKLKKLPLEACIQNSSSTMYNTEAFKWNVDANGEVSSEALGYLVTPHPNDTRTNVSVAQAVNSHGVAVGYAKGWIDETVTEPKERENSLTYAVIFKDGKVSDFTEDHSKYYNSRAYDINDAGIAVGHAVTASSGGAKERFYYVDTNVENPTMVLPEGFFTGSSSTARAINEQGFIVGEGQVETHNENSASPRRKHAFIYDTTAKTFTDLNDLLPCLSEYTVIEARDINENNEISATAIVKVHRRDSKGELMYDSNGGALVEDVTRAIKMSPIVGEIEDCSTVEEKVVRKGAGFEGGSLCLIFILGFLRRSKIKGLVFIK